MRKFGVFLGWCLFLGALAGVLYFFLDERNNGSGSVTTVCIQTQNDADSTLIVQNGAAILIDAGEEADAAHILEVMRQYGVETLDYFILTHGDKDHVGGAAKVLAKIPAKTVIQPYYEAGSEVQTLNDVLKQACVPVIYPTRTLRMHAGQIRFLVYPPLEKHYNDENNYSLAVLVQHGHVNELFAGDALRKRGEELLLIDWPVIDLYKVPHHGRANGSSEKLFDTLQPHFAVVTAQTADKAIVNAAQRNETQLFYTAQGDCVFISDAEQLQAVQ